MLVKSLDYDFLKSSFKLRNDTIKPAFFKYGRSAVHLVFSWKIIIIFTRRLTVVKLCEGLTKFLNGLSYTGVSELILCATSIINPGCRNY